MVNIQSITDSNLSFYRTLHQFEKYGEFSNLEQFRDYCNWAKANNTKLYILGNGSNTLFTRNKIRSLILRNNLDKHMKFLSEHRLEVSSSVLVIDLLKHCHENSLDSFYYLSSVPATIGGALAMNAGRGIEYGCTIYDFVESVTFFDSERDSIRTLKKEEIIRGYRETIFTGVQSSLILSAIFKFSPVTLESNPILERCKWSKQFQDYSAPNCGSVFKLAEPKILSRLKGLSIGKTCFSAKTYNWILTRSKNSNSIVFLITLVKLMHLIAGKKSIPEVVLVD